MCTRPSDTFVEPFYSLKKAFTRLLSPIPESADETSLNFSHLSSAPSTFMTPSSTILAADIAMPVTSKILSNLPEHRLLIESNLQVIRFRSLKKEWSSAHKKFYLSPLVCISPKPLSFIVGNANIDPLSSHLPTSPPIASVLNVGLLSAGTEITVASEISLNLFPMNLILTFINSNLTVDQVEDPVQGVVNFLQHPSPILTGSCLPQIPIVYF